MAPNVQLVKYCDASLELGKEYSKEQKEIIRRMYCAKATDDEFEVFMQACSRTGLSPQMRQIHFMKYGTTMSIMAGIDGLRLIAERTGKYMPGREPTYTYTKNGELFSSTAYVKKRASDGTWHECAATALFTEYKGSNVWNSKPHVMLAKCAEAQALRRAFPADMSGIYSEDEMDQVKMQARDAIDVSSCEKVDPIVGVPKVIPAIDQSGSVNAANRAALVDTLALEKEVDQWITPHDPEYKSRMLAAFGIQYMHQMTDDNITKARKNMAKKVIELKAKSEVHASELPNDFPL